MDSLDQSVFFSVGRWTDDGDQLVQTVANAAHRAVADAAFEAAKAVYPGERLTLRHGIRVIRERMPDGSERR